jgi:hypothetical protein
VPVAKGFHGGQGILFADDSISTAITIRQQQPIRPAIAPTANLEIPHSIF